jgi:hypothetical protein
MITRGFPRGQNPVATLAVSGLLVLALSGVTGCDALKKVTQKKVALKWNNAMADGIKRLRTAGTAVAAKITPAFEGKPVNAAELRQGIKDLRTTLANVREDVAAVKRPDGEKAEKLWKSYQRFMDGQAKAIDRFGAMVEILLDAKTPLPDRQARAQEIAKEVTSLESKQLAELKGHQQAFAAEWGITLEDRE